MKISLRTLLVAAGFLAGCSGSPSAPAPSCDDHAKVSGVCPGVVTTAVTADGIACSATISASNDTELATKAAAASAGTCIVLPAGTFGPVTLPAGVSLLGKSANDTTVAGVRATGGGGTLRGLTVTTGGITVSGAGTLTVDRVHVTGATAPGIAATDTNLVVTASTVEGGATAGVVSFCKTSCDATHPTLTMTSVLVKENHDAGVWAQGVDVQLTGVEVDSTHERDFRYGRGIEVANGGSVKLNGVAVLHSADVGIFIEGASAELLHFASSFNRRGVQLQAIPAAGAKLDDFAIESNEALGIGVTKGSLGIIVQGGRVAGTTSLKVPVDVGGVQEVGDGLNWLGGSEVTVSSAAHIESSARRGVIIDATSKGSFQGVLGGGDETNGIIVQGGLVASVPAGLAIAPGVKTNVLTKDEAVPVAVAVAAETAP